MALNDLNTSQAADAGIDVEIYHPKTGELLGIVITVLGSDSKAFIEADRKIRKRNLELAKKRKDIAAGLEPETIEANMIERMVACFKGWKERTEDGGFKDTIELNPGEELKATPENFRRLISDRGFFWLRQQLSTEMDKVSNFLPQPATSSSPQPSSASATTGQEKTA